MPTNTAQNDSAEPPKTADLPLRYSENGASAAIHLDSCGARERFRVSAVASVPPTGAAEHASKQPQRRGQARGIPSLPSDTGGHATPYGDARARTNGVSTGKASAVSQIVKAG